MNRNNREIIDNLPGRDRFDSSEKYFDTLDDFTRDYSRLLEEIQEDLEETESPDPETLSAIQAQINSIEAYRNGFMEPSYPSSDQNTDYLEDFSLMTEYILESARVLIDELENGPGVELEGRYSLLLEK